MLILISCSSNSTRTIKLISKDKHQSISKNYMVVTQNEASTKIGLDILKRGGNVIDAFVATSFAISVERPHSTGIGGGGFLIYHDKKTEKTYAFDFRERAPYQAFSKMYLNKKGEAQPELSIYGGLAVGTPGLVHGLYSIHQKFGKLKWQEVVMPASKLAENGFKIYPHLQIAIVEETKTLLKDPESRKLFFNKELHPLNVGDILIQKDLAHTLQIIAQKGSSGFYEGPIAKSMVETTKKFGGILTLKDLKNYETKERKPIFGTYRGYEIASMSPPSSGGVHVIEILNILENFDFKNQNAQSPDTIHRLASSMQLAFSDRASYLGDPDFTNPPIEKIIDKAYAKKLHDKIGEKAIKSKVLPFYNLESDDTTHFTIMDRDGNTATSTQTINGYFGAGFIAKGTGIFMNNEMDDFSQKLGASNLFGAIGGKNNLVEPYKRPLSSMSPTIVFKNKKPVIALGSPSGTRIISCVTQTLFNFLEFKMSLYDAVAATRIHHQWYPEELRIESPYLPKEVIKDLRSRGHLVKRQKLGCRVQAIALDSMLTGVADPRGEEGMAKGE